MWAIDAQFSILAKIYHLSIAKGAVKTYFTPVMSSILAISMPSGPELAIIFLIFFLLFGAKRLPDLARGIGKSIGEFKKAKEDFNRELEESQKKLEAQSSPPEKTVASNESELSGESRENKA